VETTTRSQCCTSSPSESQIDVVKDLPLRLVESLDGDPVIGGRTSGRGSRPRLPFRWQCNALAAAGPGQL
jgi:hypothetical protein